MKTSGSILVIIFVFLSSYCFSQPTSSFERAFGTAYDDYGNSICRDSNFNYYVAGETWGYSAGNNSDIYLVKFDSSGHVSWSTHFGDNSNESGVCILQHPGGDFFILGNYSDSGSAKVNLMLSRVDQAGNLLWSHKYNSGLNTSQKSRHMVFLPNGNMAIAGTIESTYSYMVDYRGFIQICDTAGNVINTKYYFLGAETDFANLIITNDNLITVCANAFYQTDYSIFLLKADLNGDTLWSRKYTFSHDITSTCLVELPNRKIVISGFENGNHFGNFYHCVDSSGVNVFYHNLSTLWYNRPFDLCVSPTTSMIYAAQECWNFSNYISIQTVDTLGTVSLQTRFFAYDSPSSILTNCKNPYDMDYFESSTSQPCVTLIGSTNFGQYGGYDIAIIHTSSSLVTQSEFGRPKVSAKTSDHICYGDSVLITQDSSFFPIQHWVDYAHSDRYLSFVGDSIWAHPNEVIGLIGMDADSNIWVSDPVFVNVYDTIHPNISATGSLYFCSESQSPPILSVTNFSLANRYQWFRDSIPLLNDTLSQITADTTGSYFCRRTTFCGTYDSQRINVNSNTKPNVAFASFGVLVPWCFDLQEPVSVVDVPGDHYQWYYNNNLLLNDTTYFCFQSNIIGDYTCVESNACGVDTSSYSLFQLLPANPYVSGYWCTSGDSVLLSSSEYSSNINQWYLNGIAIPGAINNTLYTSVAGDYSFDYTISTCFNVRSGTLHVQFAPQALPQSISLHTYNANICNSSSQVISLYGANGIRSYWMRNGLPFANTLDSYISVNQSGDYSCYIMNSCDTTFSDTIHMNLLPIHPINLGPDIVICNNESVVICADTGFTSYSWNVSNYGRCLVVLPPPAGGVLTYRVSTMDSSHCISTDTIIITFDYCLETNEIKSNMQSNFVYPNPFNSVLNFIDGKQDFVFAKLFSITGELLWSGKIFGEAQLDFSSVSSGLYILELLDGNTIYRQKVIKIE